MNYRIISVGKIRQPFFLDGIKEYLKRLTKYTSIELVDGLEEKISPRAGEKEIQKVLQKEAEKILNLVGEYDLLVLLDSRGKAVNSKEMAELMGTWNHSSKSRVNLVIGGANGLADSLKQKANLLISFSSMTFPHQMAVLILSEQLCRGFEIIRG